MKFKMISSFVLFALMAQVQAAQLLSPSSSDLVSNRVASLPAPAGEFERQLVSFSWGLDPHIELRPAAEHVAVSREFWMQVDGEQLRRGVDIDTTAAGALIRISPAASRTRIGTGALRVARGGQAIESTRAFAQLASSEELRAAGMEAPEGSVVARLAPELGQGRFRLQLPEASGRYLLHVFEPQSDVLLHAGARQANLLVGDALHVAVAFEANGRPLAGEVAGLLISPSGNSYDLRFVPRRGGGFEAVRPAPAEVVDHPGLWEVQVLAGSSVQGLRLQRDARTAVAIAQPTARFTGDYGFDSQALRFDAPLQVGSAGRYQVGAVLYATSEDGVARPVSQAQTAAWLEAGTARLPLAFDRAHVPGGYGAPYEIRFLELKDQSRMGVLETRQRAARLAR